MGGRGGGIIRSCYSPLLGDQQGQTVGADSRCHGRQQWSQHGFISNVQHKDIGSASLRQEDSCDRGWRPEIEQACLGICKPPTDLKLSRSSEAKHRDKLLPLAHNKQRKWLSVFLPLSYKECFMGFKRLLWLCFFYLFTLFFMWLPFFS